MKSKDVNTIIELHNSSEELVRLVTKIIKSDRTSIVSTSTSYGSCSNIYLILIYTNTVIY